jgi:hypothetical protein
MILRRSSLPVRAAAAAALVLVLAACTPGGQFDPTTIFANDMFDNKKKLQGDRAPVFPNGVPGTTAGVPEDLYKGYQPPPEQAADAGGAANTAPAEPAQTKPKPKPKPKVASAPAVHPTRINVGPAGNQPATVPQGTTTSQPQQPAASSQPNWPSSSGGPAQQTGQPSQSVWPNPAAPNTKSQ